MASDHLVTARILLTALKHVQRDRGRQALAALERQEPELLDHVLEQLGDLNHRLWAAGLSDRQARRIYRQIEQLVLTVVVAQRQAHRALWNATFEDESDDTESPKPRNGDTKREQ